MEQFPEECRETHEIQWEACGMPRVRRVSACISEESEFKLHVYLGLMLVVSVASGVAMVRRKALLTARAREGSTR
jgi:hypothetical protein